MNFKPEHADLLAEFLLAEVAHKSSSHDVKSACIAAAMREKLEILAGEDAVPTADTALMIGLIGATLRLNLLTNEAFVEEALEGFVAGLGAAIHSADGGALFKALKEEHLRAASPFNSIVA